MSREPSSGEMRYAVAHGGYNNPGPEVKPPPPPKIPKRRFKIVVPEAKPQPVRGTLPSGQHRDERGNYQRAVTKMTTTTEALTAEERQIISGYRLSVGGAAAEAERRRIEQEVRRR